MMEYGMVWCATIMMVEEIMRIESNELYHMYLRSILTSLTFNLKVIDLCDFRMCTIYIRNTIHRRFTSELRSIGWRESL